MYDILKIRNVKGHVGESKKDSVVYKYGDENRYVKSKKNKRSNGKSKKGGKKISYESYLKINGFKDSKVIKAKYIKRYC